MPFSNNQKPTTNNLLRRNLGLDAARTLAIVAMMAAHTSRMMESAVRPAWCAWILLLEPIIPSLFLLLVGVSLTISLERFRERSPAESPRTWFARQARRAAALWAISTVFYLLELGPRFPDFVVVNGVLATIAYAILGVGALLLLPRREWVLGGALAAGVAVFLALDLRGLRVFAVNTGNAPFLPLWLFTIAGALWSLARRRFPRPVFWLGLGGAGVVAFLVARFGLDPLFTKPFGRSDAGRLLAPPLFLQGEARRVGYYNLRPVLALCCLGAHLAALSLLGLLDNVRGKTSARLSALFLLGRHSLEVYVLHLSLLAVLVVTLGIRPLTSGGQGTGTLLVLVAISWIWCLWREKRVRR
ncbi:MAG: hypothetical protein K0Q91_2293 [Fibrobacteria bacterium]|nr:hypothetical protein [Fibrobacteria bacterium]